MEVKYPTMVNSCLILNWELCEELFGGTGEAFILEDGSVSTETMGVFEDTFLFCILSKIGVQIIFYITHHRISN
jgi:hypothetical protein